MPACVGCVGLASCVGMNVVFVFFCVAAANSQTFAAAEAGVNVLDAAARWPVWCAHLPPDWRVTSVLSLIECMQAQ